jgi:hypothetical protein
MDTQKVLIALLAVLVVVAGFQALQINKLGGKISGAATATAASSSGDAYAQMMKEHHGIDVNAQQTPAKSASPLDSAPNMVGGC